MKNYFSNTTFKEFKQIIKSDKTRWTFAFIAPIITPFFELITLSSIYLIVDITQRNKIIEKIKIIPFLNSMIDGLSENSLILIISLLGLIFLLFNLILRYIYELNLIKLNYTIYVKDSQRLIARYLYTDLMIARRIGKERISSSIINDCGMIGSILNYFLHLASAVLYIITYLIFAVTLSWKIMLVAIIIYVFPFLITRRLYVKMRDIGKLKVKTNERVLGYFYDILSGFQRSKLDALETYLLEEATGVFRRSQKWRIQKRKTEARILILNDGLALLGLLVILFAGVTFAKIEISVLILLFIIFTRIKTYVNNTSTQYLNIRVHYPNMDRYFNLLKELTPLRESRKTISINETETIKLDKIELKNVFFSYNANELVLDDIDFKAEAGDRILIQGPSGHGKSTLLEVLCGILPPQQGQVLVNSQNFTDELFYRIRSRITYISPTVYIFKGTLKENLVIGEDSNPDNLNQAIKLAGLKDVLVDLPDGINSLIVEDGANLSLGQRQRVILARLFFRKSKLILLDEATANLDPKLESEIVNNIISYIPADSILIMVAHKEPKGIQFNKKYFFENGKISLI